MKTPEAKIKPKSQWQKFDCMNQSAEYTCPNESNLEAVIDSISIRCCENDECIAKAKELAKKHFETLKEYMTN